jgi:hypothetical protein
MTTCGLVIVGDARIASPNSCRPPPEILSAFFKISRHLSSCPPHRPSKRWCSRISTSRKYVVWAVVLEPFLRQLSTCPLGVAITSKHTNETGPPPGLFLATKCWTGSGTIETRRPPSPALSQMVGASILVSESHHVPVSTMSSGPI